MEKSFWKGGLLRHQQQELSTAIKQHSGPSIPLFKASQAWQWNFKHLGQYDHKMDLKSERVLYPYNMFLAFL